MKIARLILGVGFILIGCWALVDFVSLSRQFMFMSPDGSVTGFMMLLLRMCMVGLGFVGLLLLLFDRFTDIVSRCNRFIAEIDQATFLKVTLGGAFLLRLIVVLFFPHQIWGDYASYDDLATQWADKGGYYNGDHLTAYWPPAYPFLLSRIYLLFNYSPTAGVLVNLFFGMAIVWLTYLIARQVWGDQTARWTMVIMALFPSQIFYCNTLASEMLFTPLLLLSILFALRLPEKTNKQWLWAAGCGLLIGLASLTRSIASVVPFILNFFLLIRIRKLRAVLTNGLLILIGFAIVCVPWMYRNQQAVGSFKINTNAGINLYQGNQPSSGMGYNATAADEFDVNDASQEAYIDSVTTTRAVDYILEHPISFLKRGVLKTGFFYAIDIEGLFWEVHEAGEQGYIDVWVILAEIGQIYYMLILLLSGIGIISFYSQHKGWSSAGSILLLLIILYWTTVHFVFFSLGRYHFPIIPLLCCFAAVYLSSLNRSKPKFT